MGVARILTRLSGCLRKSDLAAGIGGDEFAAIVTDVEDEDALGCVPGTRRFQGRSTPTRSRANGPFSLRSRARAGRRTP